MTNKIAKIIDKNRKPIAFILIALITVIIFIIFIIFYKEFYSENIEVDVSSLKSTVTVGEESVSNIKIKNKGFEIESVSFNVIGELGDLFGSEKEIKLKPREEKDFKIFFRSSSSPGVFIGKLQISYDNDIISIPIILEVQSKKNLFDSNINLFPFGGNYLHGDKITSEINVFDLADVGRSNVKISHFIRDFDDNTIVSDIDSLIIDEKFEYSKTLSLPQNIKLGSYVLVIITEYKDSVTTSSIVFNIVSEKKKDIDETILLVFIVFGFLVILSMGFFVYYLFYRDRLLKELHNQYKLELKDRKRLLN